MVAATQASARTPDSIAEAVLHYEQQGFRGQFAVRPAGLVKCLCCEIVTPPAKVRMLALHRLEGDSDPADEVAVAALQCGACRQRGTLVLGYGPEASAEDKLVLAGLDDRRGRDAALPPGL